MSSGTEPEEQHSLRVRRNAGEQLAAIARDAYTRGWAAATSGNFSVVLERAPLRLAITASGRHKGRLSANDVVEVDGNGAVVGVGAPSAETAIHLAIVHALPDVGAAAHVHSVSSTLASQRLPVENGGIILSDLEMLKAFSGVTTHEHRELVPVVENRQDWDAGAEAIDALLAAYPDIHGFLIRGHGLYTWGRDLDEAWRHLEAFDYLFELALRRSQTGRR